MTNAEILNWTEFKRQKFEVIFTKLWQRKLYSQIQPFVEFLQNPYNIHSIGQVHLHDDISKLYTDTWKIPGREFAKLTFNEYKKQISFQYRTKDSFDDFWSDEMQRYILNESGARIVSIGNNNREIILKILRGSMAKSESEGLGVAEIAKRMIEDLKREMRDMSRANAMRIARTEIVGASNKGSLLGAQSLGYNMRKTWIPKIDRATRTFQNSQFDHAITETVSIDQPFVKTGEPLMYPGDINGSSGNVINCRCAQGFEVI